MIDLLRRHKFLLFAIFLLQFRIFGKALGEEGGYPRPIGFVNDFARIIQESARKEIESLCADLERRTTAEVAVVTIPSTGSVPIEDYAVELFNRWGIGKRGKDNGVLILVAVRDRKVRIEVGYGLEPVLTDARAGDIIRNVLVPAFRTGDFGGGILKAVQEIGSLISGEGPPEVATPEEKGPYLIPFLAYYLFLLFFSFIAGGFILFSIIGSFAALLGFVSLIFAFLSVPFPLFLKGVVHIVPFLLVAFGSIFLFFLRASKMRALRRKYKTRWAEHFPWWLYGFPYSGGSGGIRGGGGWSSGGFGGFGGGSSGGGGASGSW